ncbi:Poly-beta-1,6-N-acetyl-D-glucosamine synthase [Planctomycetes bacterium Poly30]|uniref:Poly-beta-1,6-N-acetyl-D-glucosamine synthase n=1 Tax=Saltatorellus ferox TaxID=2528018 RepID=A0A518EUY7_9BACT|nr:Poly-beta-1,6-N-acetyl-D-glucosamine synthase [Planctomycetes bacterium Poly30]
MIGEILSALAVGADQWVDNWSGRLSQSGWADWMLFFAPVLFLEVPQYYVPLVATSWKKLSRKPGETGAGEMAPRSNRAQFQRKWPSVSVVVAGRNEAESIEACIRSLVDQGYPNLEIIVVDDHSEDETYAIAKRYARKGVIRVIRNNEEIGRSGRPTASNLGMRFANGDILVSLDADTTFDKGLIEALVRPFDDPQIGIVAGNVLVRNREKNLLTRIQTIEYAVSIDLHKRWSRMTGSTLQASGAIGAFRRSALLDIGGWDPELAEDGDICLRLVKAGWRVTFAPEAVALTDVPDSWKVIIKQRNRWDRGGYRAYFAKHGRLLRPSKSTAGYAYGMWGELVFSTILPLMYPFYVVWLLAQGFSLWSFVVLTSTALYLLLAPLPLVAIAIVSTRTKDVIGLLGAAFVMPFYRALMRWVKIRALLREIFRTKYEDSFLPNSAWNNAPRY